DAAAGERPDAVPKPHERHPAGRVEHDSADSEPPGEVGHATSSRSALNQRRRSAYGTAAFAGEVDGSTKRTVFPSRRSCSPCSGRSRKAPRYASLPTKPIM